MGGERNIGEVETQLSYHQIHFTRIFLISYKTVPLTAFGGKGGSLSNVLIAWFLSILLEYFSRLMFSDYENVNMASTSAINPIGTLLLVDQINSLLL
jgi:hypothetical protein